MTTEHTTWHAEDGELAAYRAGDCAPVLAASLEAHLVRCGRCRAALARVAVPAHTERRWLRLAEAVDRPSPGLLDRVGLGRLLDHGLGRVALSSPHLVRAWLASLVLVVGLPLMAAEAAGTDGATILLALAPLTPAAAVVLAYRDAADPAGELARATPSTGLRLVALRALAVSAAAVPLSLGLGVLNGLAVGVSLGWVLPGAALAALVLLAGTTRVDPLHAAAALSLTWAVAVAVPSTARSVAAGVVVETVTSPALQATALTVATLALLLTIARRDTVAYRRTA